VTRVTEQLVLPHLWRRYLHILRTLLGASCIWIVLASQGLTRPAFLGLLSALCLYSAVTVFWRWPARLDVFELLNFLLDIQCFLLCVALSPPAGFWMCAVAAFYLLLAAATLHEWRDVLLLVVLQMAFVTFIGPSFIDRLMPVCLVLGMFGCVVALQKRALMDRLSSSLRQAVVYRSQNERARENERERIAADFHDGPLQSFIGFQMRLAIIRKMMDRNPDSARAELEQLQELTLKQVTEIRTFVRGMRPVEIHGAGLASALRTLVGHFQKDSGIAASFEVEAAASHDDLEPKIDVLQMVREALNNVRKHSGASRASVRLGRANGMVEIQVEDDGSGFPFAGKFNLEELETLRMGPESIKRRVRSMEGELELESRPGRGAVLSIRIPA